MPTARISRLTRTNRPTRNSDQVNSLRCAMRKLLRASVPAYSTEPQRGLLIFLSRQRREFRQTRAPKREPTCTLYRNCRKFLSGVNHHSANSPKLNQEPLQVRIIGSEELLGAPLKIDFAIAQNQKARRGGAGFFPRAITADTPRGGIEMEIGERKAVLQALRGEQGGDAVNVAQAQDERGDGLRGDGVEARGRRIIEQDGRTVNDRAGDGHTAAHASGKLRG